MIYFCNNCGRFLTENDIKIEHTSYESLYGVSDLFPDSHNCDIQVCAFCGCEDIEEYEELYDFNEEIAVEVFNDKLYENKQLIKHKYNSKIKNLYKKYEEKLKNCVDPYQHTIYEEILKELDNVLRLE